MMHVMLEVVVSLFIILCGQILHPILVVLVWADSFLSIFQLWSELVAFMSGWGLSMFDFSHEMVAVVDDSTKRHVVVVWDLL